MKEKVVKLKLIELINAVPSIRELLKKDMNPTISFKLALQLRKIQPHLESYSEARDKLVSKYSQNEKLEPVNVNSEFKANIESLNQTEVEFTFDTVKIDDLKTSKGDKIDVNTEIFFNLCWLFSE